MTNNWQTYKLSEICEIISGGTPKTSIAEYWNGNIFWLSVKDFNTDSKYVYKSEKTITELGLKNSSTNILQKGDIIISARGTVGELAMIPYDMAFNQSCYGLRAKEMIESNFLYYLLKNNINILKNNTHGSVFDTITRNTFDDIEISLPPLGEQNKIAGVLSALDDKIELNNKINNNLEQQALSLLLNYIENTNEKVPLKKIISFVNGFAFKSQDYLNSGKYKVITIKNVQDGKVDSLGTSFINDLPTKLSSECCLNIGDVLLSLTGNVGRVGIVTENNLLLNQRVAKIQPIKEDILPFIYFYLRLPSFKNEMENISKGTAQQNLSPVETLKLEISYDKNNISNISKTLKTFYDEIIFNDMQNRTLSSIRDALLPKLMSGEIDVENLPPSAIIPK